MDREVQEKIKELEEKVRALENKVFPIPQTKKSYFPSLFQRRNPDVEGTLLNKANKEIRVRDDNMNRAESLANRQIPRHPEYREPIETDRMNLGGRKRTRRRRKSRRS